MFSPKHTHTHAHTPRVGREESNNSTQMRKEKPIETYFCYFIISAFQV